MPITPGDIIPGEPTHGAPPYGNPTNPTQAGPAPSYIPYNQVYWYSGVPYVYDQGQWFYSTPAGSKQGPVPGNSNPAGGDSNGNGSGSGSSSGNSSGGTQTAPGGGPPGYNYPGAYNFNDYFGPQGGPKISEGEYISLSRAYVAAGKQYGFAVTPSQINAWIAASVSPDEVTARFTDLQYMKDNPAMSREFGQLLYAKGLKAAPGWTFQEKIAYVKGQSPAEWYNTASYFHVMADAVRAGLDPGSSGAYGVSWDTIFKIAKGNYGQEQVGQFAENFQKLAQDFKYVIPTARWTGFGVSKAELVALEFGSDKPGQQVEVADKVKRALSTYQAAQQPRANPQSFATATGPAMGGYGGTSGGATQ